MSTIPTPTTPSYPIQPAPFPALTRTATALIANTPTTATSLSFTDKLLLTITQNGRLAHWIHVPLDTPLPDGSLPSSSSHYDDDDDDDDDNNNDEDGAGKEEGGGGAGNPLAAILIPLPHLTATTVLGGTRPERDVVGQLFATQIASAIAVRQPQERRLVVLGLGLESGVVEEGVGGGMGEGERERERGVWMDLLELAMRVV